jgi:hypothetical protein
MHDPERNWEHGTRNERIQLSVVYRVRTELSTGANKAPNRKIQDHVNNGQWGTHVMRTDQMADAVKKTLLCGHVSWLS